MIYIDIIAMLNERTYRPVQTELNWDKMCTEMKPALLSSSIYVQHRCI